jgi:cystathionine beta-lyase/cystathionine gamma-synthase
LSAEDKKEMGISPYSLRLSVGLEDAEDLIEDLKQTLDGK